MRSRTSNRFHARRALAALVVPWVLAPSLLATPARANLEAAQDLVQESLFAAHDNGPGQDLSIAVLEPQACIAEDHPDFDLIHFEPRIPDEPCEPSYGRDGIIAHATKVTSALATARPDGHGGRGFAGLFAGHAFAVASDVTVNGRPAYEAMIARNPDFVNMSFTTAFKDRYWMDRAVYEDRIFIANASGNWGGDPEDLARCWSYNSLCVGGYSHRGTTGPFYFYDDTFVGGSSWRNSPVSGREEPDVVGPWYHEVALPPQSHEHEGGTSYATPSVLGLAALLTANYPQELRREPTLLRALLLASASHPVLDDSGKHGIPDFSDAVDDRSGAGAPRGDRASSMVSSRRYFADRVDRDRDFAGDGAFLRPLSFTATKGQRVRVALAWDQCPVDTRDDGDFLVADLDMTVRGPDHDWRDELRSVNLYPQSGGVQPLSLEEETPDAGSSPRRTKGRSKPGYEKPTLLGLLDFQANDVVASVNTGTLDGTTTSGDGDALASAPSLDPDVLASATDASAGQYQEPAREEIPALYRVPTVVQNHSRVDNFELVEFKALVGGTYEIELQAQRWDDCEYDGLRQTYMAVAWDVQ